MKLSVFPANEIPDCLWSFPKTAEGINLMQNPLYVILDIGCTRSMGSRHAIEAFRRHCGPSGLTTEILPSSSYFTFAGGGGTKVYEKCRIWFPTEPPTYTDVDICEQGQVPILLSVFQMRNMNMTLEMTSEAVLLTCPMLGMNRRPCPMSTSHHLVINLADIRRTPKKSLPNEGKCVCILQPEHRLGCHPPERLILCRLSGL